MDIDIDCLNRIQNGTKLRKFESALSSSKFLQLDKTRPRFELNKMHNSKINNHYTIIARINDTS